MFFRITPALKILLILNIAIYFINNLLFGGIVVSGIPLRYWVIDIFALQPIYDNYAITNSGILGFGFGIWQLITYQFLHADFGHLFFNMFALYMFSTELEETWGSGKYLFFYLISGIGAGLLHLLISPLLGQTAPTIGASGSLYGIIIAFAMLNPDRRIIMFPLFIPIPARVFGIGMMAISLIIGLTSQDGIAHFAHFGGALTGILLLKFGERTPIFRFARKYVKFGIPSYEHIDNSNRRRKINPSGSIFDRKYQSSDPNSNYYAHWSNPNKNVQTNVSQPKTYTKSSNVLNNIEIGGVIITQEKIDEILDKISESGYKSLTEQEKYILTEISKKI